MVGGNALSDVLTSTGRTKVRITFSLLMKSFIGVIIEVTLMQERERDSLSPTQPVQTHFQCACLIYSTTDLHNLRFSHLLTKSGPCRTAEYYDADRRNQ